MFNWDIIQHEDSKAPFEFQADGNVWRVPHIVNLTVGQQIEADGGGLHKVFREVAEVQDDAGEWQPVGRKAADLILGKHSDQVAAFRVAWLAHAGVKPGESQASSR